MTNSLNLNGYYTISAKAVIRPERFGGLVYRYDNRRLYFLHSHELVEFVREALDGQQTLDATLKQFIDAHQLPANAREVFLKALVQLKKLEVIHEL
ncbi:MAG: mycofactocin biosynthesis chaperone MftB [Ardenticatenaceae bacterium]